MAIAWRRPASVSASSVWLVCRPVRLHSVSPWRTSTTSPPVATGSVWPRYGDRVASSRDARLDADAAALARRIAELGAGERAGVFHLSWWSERMLAWAMGHPAFKTELFRFVDVFPALTGDAAVLRPLEAYFHRAEAPTATGP